MEDKRIQLNSTFKKVQPFLIGGISGCVATTMIQPIDMVKVRIQLLPTGQGISKNPFSVALGVYKENGLRGFYKGLDAGLLRQITYTTARFGIFDVVSNLLKDKKENTLSLGKKVVAGLVAGGLGSLIGNPADLSLIRLQADATLPMEQRRNYSGAMNAMFRIIKEEGFFSLWKGTGPTVTRAMALNMGMFVSFDQTKEELKKRNLCLAYTTPIACAVSGFFSVTFSLPLDLMKTKIQRMKIDPVTNQYPYKNMLDCIRKTWIESGFFGFYRGYLTYYVRIAPHVMISLIVADTLRKNINLHFK